MRKRKEQTIVTTAPVELLDIPEVARRLKVGRTKVYHLIKHHGLPVVTVGDVARVSLASLQRWIVENEQIS
jgi:excisionase family DNA binding protein